MSVASQWAFFFPKLRDQAVAAGKLIMVEEWGIGTTPGNEPVAVQAKVFNSAGVPWVSSFSFCAHIPMKNRYINAICI